MEKKLTRIMEDISYEDLYKMKNDLDNGGDHLKRLVEKKIKEVENQEVKTCATCGNPVNLVTNKYYSIIFGPPDLRKKAYFCALDCLDYFIQKLKEVESKKIKLMQ